MREQLILAAAYRGALEHECDLRGDVITSLPAWLTLAPALDRHGWTSSGHRQRAGGELEQRAMTPRALTQVLAWRCGQQPHTVSSGQQTEGGSGDAIECVAVAEDAPEPVFDDTTFDRLDAACDRADELNARVEKLLADLG